MHSLVQIIHSFEVVNFRVSRYDHLPTSTLGEQIRRKRLMQGLEQKELAKMIGVSETTVYLWEKDRRSPRPEYLKKLSDILSM